MTGIFLQLSRVLPDEYPLTGEVNNYLSNELGFGRLLDYGVIVPRLQQLSARSRPNAGRRSRPIAPETADRRLLRWSGVASDGPGEARRAGS